MTELTPLEKGDVITVHLKLQVRGRKQSRYVYYQCPLKLGGSGYTQREDFEPYYLEKTGVAFGLPFTTRLRFKVDSWDYATRTLLLSYSEVASRFHALDLDLLYGYGFQELAAEDYRGVT